MSDEFVWTYLAICGGWCLGLGLAMLIPWIGDFVSSPPWVKHPYPETRDQWRDPMHQEPTR